MPRYMDVHENLPGVTAADVAAAHAKDVAIQDQYDVNFRSYWVDEAAGKVFCLVDAPNAEAANQVHQHAHGLVADHIHEVVEGS